MNRSRADVLIADDASIIRKASASILDTEPSIGILGHAESFSQTIEMTAALKPDVILGPTDAR